MKCKNCKYWENWNDEVGECLTVISKHDMEDDDLARIDDKDEGVGALITLANFFCASFKEKS